MARSAVSFAALYSLLRPPRAPLAASMIFFLRAWWATPDLTRGMDRSLGLEEAVHAREVGRAHDITLLEPILPLARLLGQDVAVVRVEALELPRAGTLEPLHGGALGLLLRHLCPLCRRKGAPPHRSRLPQAHRREVIKPYAGAPVRLSASLRRDHHRHVPPL